MRILLLSDEFPPDGSGGDGIVVSNLARGYKERGHDVYVAAAAHKPENAGHHTWEGIPVEKVYADYHPRWQAYVSLYNPPAVRMVKKVLKEFRPNVVHVHGVNRYLSYATIVFAKKSGARVCMTAHDAMLYHYGKAFDEKKVSGMQLLRLYRFTYNPIRNFIIRRVIRNIDAIISISESLARALRANNIPVAGVVHNGIRVDAWNVSDKVVADFKDKFHLGDRVVLFGGRLSGLKGAFVTIEAFAVAQKNIPDAQLCIIGTKNDIAEKMETRAQELGIKKNILFTGRISGDELKAAYHSARVVTVLSRYLDGFPTINLEAHACGRPVIATSLGGSPEIVKNGVTGYIVNPFNESEIAEKMIDLLADRAKADQFGAAGYQHVKDNFSLEEHVSNYLEFLGGTQPLSLT